MSLVCLSLFSKMKKWVWTPFQALLVQCRYIAEIGTSIESIRKAARQTRHLVAACLCKLGLAGTLPQMFNPEFIAQVMLIVLQAFDDAQEYKVPPCYLLFQLWNVYALLHKNNCAPFLTTSHYLYIFFLSSHDSATWYWALLKIFIIFLWIQSARTKCMKGLQTKDSLANCGMFVKVIIVFVERSSRPGARNVIRGGQQGSVQEWDFAAATSRPMVYMWYAWSGSRICETGP